MHDRKEPPAAAGRPPGLVDWWFRDRRTGRFAIVQWPNAALGVWIATVVVDWFGLFSERAEEMRWMGRGALIAWAVDEILRGVSPARRVLGAVVLGWQAYRLVG
jgi:hypothetical protein